MALTIANVKSPGLTDSAWYCTATTDATAAADQNIYCGFKPRECYVLNITDLLESRFFTGMTAAHELHTVGSTGVVTEVTTEGFTLLDGSEVVPASTLVALGAGNGTQGPGVTLGTNVLVASKSYIIKLVP